MLETHEGIGKVHCRLRSAEVIVKVKLRTLDIARLHESSPQKRSGVARGTPVAVSAYLQSGGCGFESRPGLFRTEVYSAFHPSGVGK